MNASDAWWGILMRIRGFDVGVRAAWLALMLAGSVTGCEEGDPGPIPADAGTLIDAALNDTGDASDLARLEVSTSAGALRGKLVGSTRAFLGIPYAVPPVGERRFMPPEPVIPWSGVRDATALGPACPQPPGAVAAAPPYSEDCLTLNVFTPAAGGTKRPVMVWTHGGAYVSGGSSQYNATRLSEEGGVVVVTFNYRLGALGFFSLPELDATRPDAPSGNDALRDQQLVLRWVQDNIAVFDGDPDAVTLFGESAGAVATCLQMVSPTAQTLAKRYVLQSGTCIGGLPLSNKAAANAIGQDLTSSLCPNAPDKLACLRSLDAQELAVWGAERGITGAGWFPVINAADPLLPAHPLTMILSGQTKDAELMLGTNRNEWSLFAELVGPNPKMVSAVEEAVDVSLSGLSPARRAALKQHYITDAQPPVTDATASRTYIRLMTDVTFRCPVREHARLSALLGRKTYLYSFEHGLATHAYEIPFLFGVPNTFVMSDLDPVHAVMASYWLQFAKSGDPNLGGLASWPAYDPASDRHMTIKVNPTEGSGLSRDDCDFVTALLARP